jgi:hypothetical protein
VCHINLAFFDDGSTLRWALLEGFYLAGDICILRYVVKRGLRIKGLCNGVLLEILVTNVADARFKPATIVSFGVGHFRFEKFIGIGRRELPK